MNLRSCHFQCASSDRASFNAASASPTPAGPGDAVERAETLRGYEVARDQYVALTDAELDALHRRTDATIEIDGFVPIEAVDPLYFDSANLLGPDRGPDLHLRARAGGASLAPRRHRDQPSREPPGPLE